MKLNADIIYSELSAMYDVSVSGRRSAELSIGRPRIYIDDDDRFLKNCLYLASAEHLPKRPHIQQNVVLVCVGDALALSYYRERLCLITVSGKTDFFRLFSDIQNICDKYDAWEHRLYQDLLQGSRLSDFLDDSKDILGVPLYLMDETFRFVAYTGGSSRESWMKDSSGSLSPESLSEFLTGSELMMEKKRAIKLDFEKNKTVCVNLFDRSDRYKGCLCADMTERGINDGDAALVEFLAGFIEHAIDRSPQFSTEATQFRNLLQSLVEEMPLNRSQRMLLSSDETGTYICICFRNRGGKAIPLPYVRDVIEDTYTDSHAFVSDDMIVSFLSLPYKDPAGKPAFYQSLRDLCSQLRVSCGVSNAFTDLLDARLYYLQAVSALENGQLLSPGDALFSFSSYALTEMIINSLGDLPLEAYFPEGLAAVIEHDRTAPVSYLETLRVLLEENLSYTAAARRLYIHRTTLLDRIGRIEREMGVDLKDPEQRLQIEMLLRAMDLQEVIRQGHAMPESLA